MANDVKPRQQFVVRSYKCRDFQLSGSTSAFNWKKSTCSPPSWIPQKMEVLHFKQNIRLKGWFLSIPNGLVIKKDFTSHMIIGHTRELSNKKKKKHRGSSTIWSCFAQSSNVDGKRRTWTLESGHVTSGRLRSHVFRDKCGSKTPLCISPPCSVNGFK